MISDWMPEIGVIVIILSAVAFAASRMLVVRIQEHEVGIVIKKWGNASLPAHRLVALHGEAGLQADTLAPAAMRLTKRSGQRSPDTITR